MEKKAVILQVYGRVQGVGFRYYTNKRAQELGIHGFVKNQPDGSVYIEAEGMEGELETFISWCNAGPQWARVSEVKREDTPLSGHKTFIVR